VDRKPAYGQYSLFAQDQFQFDARNQFFLGARYDAYHSFSAGVQSRLSPRLAYVRHFPGRGNGKLAYGEAYRAPTIYESLYQDGIPQAESLWESPDLRPEITRTLEAIWESPTARDFSWNARAYLTRLTNYPVLNDVPVFNGNPCLLAQCNQYQNSDRTAQVTGVEGSLKWRREGGLSGYASATWQRGIRTADGAELPSAPRLLMKGGLHAPLGSGWKGALEASFVGRVEGRLENDGTRSTPAPGYLLVHAHLYADKLGDGWRASLRINNLFDRRYYSVASPELPPLNLVPGTGRMVSFHLSKDF
jgi:outer membrane receptor protein involved in Fe transport